jgi:hypothetical protein
LAELSSGSARRQLEQAQAGMKKARQALRVVRERNDPETRHHALRVGWESLVRAHRLMSEIPLAAADDAVLTKQLAAQRYATALLVRLRRLVRNELGAPDAEDALDDDI